jgi:hypothetical protein
MFRCKYTQYTYIKCPRKINTDENDNKGEKKTPKFHQKRRGKTDGVQ